MLLRRSSHDTPCSFFVDHRGVGKHISIKSNHWDTKPTASQIVRRVTDGRAPTQKNRLSGGDTGRASIPRSGKRLVSEELLEDRAEYFFSRNSSKSRKKGRQQDVPCRRIMSFLRSDHLEIVSNTILSQ